MSQGTDNRAALESKSQYKDPGPAYMGPCSAYDIESTFHKML